MNCMCYETKFNPEITKLNIMKAVKNMPKLTYKIVEIAGDYYYQKMSIEETFSKAMITQTDEKLKLKSKEDIDRYIQDNIGQKMPMDGPLW